MIIAMRNSPPNSSELDPDSTTGFAYCRLYPGILQSMRIPDRLGVPLSGIPTLKAGACSNCCSEHDMTPLVHYLFRCHKLRGGYPTSHNLVIKDPDPCFP